MTKKIQLLSISEKELEACLKCSICTVYCPVSGVTTRYPGPKQAGPDGERYRMKDPRYYDDKALKMCLNCKRCEVACPQGVQIGDIIQSARIRYAPYARSWRPFPFLRETLLCNTCSPMVSWPSTSVGLCLSMHRRPSASGIRRTVQRSSAAILTRWVSSMDAMSTTTIPSWERNS